MHGLRYREELDEVTAREFDALISRLKAFLLLEHNEDGTHKKSTLTSAADPANDHDSSTTITTDSTRRWRGPGAWELDDPNATDRHVVGLRPPDPPAGT